MKKKFIRDQLETVKTAIYVLRSNAEDDVIPYGLHKALLSDADSLEKMYEAIMKELDK